jgi:hypothetical protein
METPAPKNDNPNSNYIDVAVDVTEIENQMNKIVNTKVFFYPEKQDGRCVGGEDIGTYVGIGVTYDKPGIFFIVVDNNSRCHFIDRLASTSNNELTDGKHKYWYEMRNSHIDFNIQDR